MTVISAHPSCALAFLQEGGQTGALMRRTDWAATRLGPPETWPQALKTAVSLALRARQPMFIGWGPDLICLYNDASIPICGDKHPHALGRPMREVWSEIWDTLAPLNEAVLRGESHWFENKPFALAGRGAGGPSYFSFSYSPLLDDDGCIGGIFCSALETTSSVRLAQRSDGEMQRLQRLFEQAPGFVCSLRGPDHVFEFVNDTHRRLFDRPDIVGKTIREAFPDIDGLGLYELMDEVYRTGRQRAVRGLHAQLRGTAGAPPREVLLDFVFAPMFDATGQVGGIFCEGVDATAAQAAERALLEKEELLRLATEAAEIGMWDVNLQTGTLYWGPRVRRMFGIATQGEVTMADFHACVHPDDREATAAAFDSACDPGVRAVYDVKYRTIGRDDGVERWVAAKGRGLFDAQGRCVRAIGTVIDISAHKATEQAMEVALAASRTGTFNWDILDNRLTWDSALDRLFGLPPGQAVRSLDQFVALVHPEDRAGVVARCERCRDEAADFEMEFRVVHPDGSIHWLYDRGRTFVDASGRAKTMTGACVDVTQRREAEAALRDSELFYRRTLESVPGITFTATAGGAWDYLSDQWEDYTGVPFAVPGDGWLQALHPDDRPRTATAWNTAVREGTPFAAECRVRRRDGAWQWFKAQARAIAAVDAAQARWIGSIHNVHDLKETQATLQARERELQSLADNSPDVIGRFDAALRHVFVNAAAERLTGLPVPLFIGRTLEELGMPAALCEPWNQALRKVFDEGRPVSTQFAMEEGGLLRHFAARLVPEPAEDGTVPHVLAVTRDITDLWQAQEALRRADRQKDDFLATLAHELRNPLAPLRTGLHVLRRRDGTPEERRVRQIMERQLDHLVRLVDELLDIARISQGKIVLQRETLPLQIVLEHAMDASRPLMDAQGHTLVSDGVDGSWYVHADVTRLVQVVGNLLNNAAKYTPPGGHVSLRVREDGEGLAIEVEDDGIGIPRDLLGRVFDRFVQVDQHVERAQGGLGIGLSVVKSLVEMHGGHVAAESAGPGAGSRFIVWLPRAHIERADQREHEAAVQGAAPVPPRKVLVVDDNRDAAETLAMIIGMAGHEVHLAHDGAAALEMAVAHQPAIVFLDIGMPGMDGYETAGRLRALPGWQSRLLVALTGWGSEQDRARTLSSGFDIHLTKPVDVSAVEGLLSGAGQAPTVVGA